MAGSPPQSASSLLVADFRQRFALIDRIGGAFGDECSPERIPWFFGFLLAAANNPAPGGHCFVLDMSPGTTAIAALLTALSRLKDSFPKLVEDYARTAFTPGQRVRVLPADDVFEYDGLWPEFPGQFKLKLLGTETRSFRSFPLADVLRLEPTDRIRPRGTGASVLGQRAIGPLDRLLDFSSCGNNSIIRNVVLCQMSRIQFARAIDLINLAPAQANTLERLSHFLPWGSVAPDGVLHPNDPHQAVGEPLIAVSGIAEDIARNCKDSPASTKIVFADGPQRFIRDLQAYDDVVQKQRLILLASPTDIDDLDLLRNRGCTIWRMSSAEMLIGEETPHRRERSSLIGKTIRAAAVRQRSVITTIDCVDERVDAIARALEKVSASLNESEQTIELEEALARLFGLLFECSECCFGLPETALGSIETVRSAINRNARWLSAVDAENLRTAIDGLISITKGQEAHGKADALVELLKKPPIEIERWAVLGRSPRICASLISGLKKHGLTPVVTAISSVTSESEYDGIVLAGWPNDSRFRRLVELEVAADIRVLTYGFENKWFDRYRTKTRRLAESESLTLEERARIIQVAPSRLNGEATHDPFTGVDNATASAEDARVFEFEARVTRRHSSLSVPLSDSVHELRPTRLVRFAGACHAFLTEWAELSILNEVIEHNETDGARIQRKTVAAFIPGDFLLFRAGGDKEFVRLIAEDLMGAENYTRQRTVADRWKTALHSLGTSPAAVQRRLAEVGLNRTSVTIGSWLGDPNRIGPGNDDDIAVIAKVAEDANLLASLPQVTEAISTIRSAHLSAGLRLTKLILGELRDRVRNIRDEPTLLDLGYGQAWVVRVESIESEIVNCPANKANRLLWDAEAGF